MSLVGTRPPTVDEWDKYELHHRARLATKPGLTGMWQVSGRSNITDLMSSSSGGVFIALSDFFLENGNAVAAAIYNYDNHTTEFQMILDKKQQERAKGSKYMQSKPGDIYRETYHWLKENPEKKLLFVGMGCQSDGFRKFSEIKGIRDRVYIVRKALRPFMSIW